MPLDPYFDEMLRAKRVDTFAGVRAQIVDVVRDILPFAVPPAPSGPTPPSASATFLFGADSVGNPSAPAKAGRAAASTAAPSTPTGAAGSEPAPAPAPSPAPAPKTAARSHPAPPPAPSREAQRAKEREKKALRKTAAWKYRNAQKWDTKLYNKVGWPAPELASDDHTVVVPGYPDVRVRIYRPDDAAPRIPAVITFFGGSFQLGGIDWTSVDASYRLRTRDSGVAHVAVDYSRAPEWRYPTPVEQGYATLAWLVENADELGIDPARIALNGTSAGGNIAAATALMNHDRMSHPIALQLLEVPVTDLTGGHIDLAPIRAMGIPTFLARRELTSVPATYLGDRSRDRERYASPLLADDLSGLPPAYVFTSEYDALRADGQAYAAALRRAGVEAHAVQYQGANHEAAMFTAVVPLARRWHHDAVAVLRTLHALGSGHEQLHPATAARDE
jgi:acetyl esterase